MVIVWRLRGNLIRTALCWVVGHNVYLARVQALAGQQSFAFCGPAAWNSLICCAWC